MSIDEKKRIRFNVVNAIENTIKYYESEMGQRMANVFDIADAVISEIEAAKAEQPKFGKSRISDTEYVSAQRAENVRLTKEIEEIIINDQPVDITVAMLENMIREMKVAHDMSHEAFCDGADWKDTFELKSEAALSLIKDLEGATKRESGDREAFEVLARTLESINGDAECLLKRARNEGVSKSSAINICSEIARKSRAIRHLYKDWLFSL